MVGRWTLVLLVTSAAVWLATLPLVLYRFHIGSPVALVISPAVWLVALVAMWAGFVTLACGWLVPFVAVVAGKVCGYSLGWLVELVNWAEGLSWGHFWSPGPALWWLVGFYLGFDGRDDLGPGDRGDCAGRWDSRRLGSSWVSCRRCGRM